MSLIRLRLSVSAFFAFALIAGGSARAELVYVSTLDGWGHPYAFESVDTASGAVNVISTDTPSMTGMAFVNGQLYGLGYGSGDLYRIDTTTGAATDLGTTTHPGNGGSDLVAGPGDSVYLFDDSGSVSTLTPPSPSTTLTNLPGIGPYGSYPKYAAGPDGRIYGVPYDPFNPLPQQLQILDPTTGQLTSGPVLSPQGIIPDHSHLFFDGSTLDIVSPTGLYTIDTTTGAVTQGFTFSSNIGGVFAAAAMPSAVPEPSSLTLCGIAAALMGIARTRFRRRQ